jgi:hypothetical protein
MKIRKTYIILGLIIAFICFFELAAHAAESDQATTITFNQSIQIPGQILPAGTYLLKLASPDVNQNLVQIFNSDGTALYATLQTVAAERREPTGNTAVTLAEQGAGKPDVLLKWFYPGRLIGDEFVYSKQTEKELAQDRQQTIVANQQAVPYSDTTGAGN